MRKILLLLIALTATFCAIAPFCHQTHYYSLASPLRRFSSYEELKSFLKASSQVSYDYGLDRATSGSFLLGTETEESLLETYGVPDYSTTNIQVEGVDEADIVKTDGEFIYIVSGEKLTILKAYPAEEAEVLSQITLNGTIKGTFINEDRLAIFEETSQTSVKVYDISNRENPVWKRTESMDGSYFNSRMIGDYVYVVITQPVYYIEDEVSLPQIYSGDRIEEICASEIYYSDAPDRSYGFTTILALNVQNDEEESTHITFLLGGTSGMYVSLNNIYITFRQGGNTRIYRFHIEGSAIHCKADGEVQGYVLNQFSMDEHEGYFRVATTTGHSASARNHLYVLDMNLTIVGRLEDLAPTEKIYSARFMGDRCYLVTFRKVDPLFVIDLENPYNPEVLGKLKIPGYSDYLHPYDENHIIGVGRENGVKISLFDVSDVENPEEMAKYEIGDWRTDSPILREHKAFLFDRPRNLLVIPVSGVPFSGHKSDTWQGAYVFDVSLSEKIVLKGRITHLENDMTESGYYFSSSYEVKRSLYIDNVLYTVSDKKICMHLLSDLSFVNSIDLP